MLASCLTSACTRQNRLSLAVQGTSRAKSVSQVKQSLDRQTGWESRASGQADINKAPIGRPDGQ